MKTYLIKSKKQDNGLWSMPMKCIGIDKMMFNDKRKMLIESAALVLFSQIFYNCKFKISNSTDRGFIVDIYQNDGNVKINPFLYENYELIDNTLYEFDNNKEHISFLRIHKLQRLENIL